MRVVRRASLIFSLTLIVAIAVGYVARRSEMAGQRDQGLATAAQIGASRMGAIVSATEIATATGFDPESTADALAAAHPVLNVCAVDAERSSCAGEGSAPSNDLVEERRGARSSLDAATGRAVVTAYESMIIVAVDGPRLSLVAQVPTDAVDERGEIAVWATTFVPRGTTNGFAVERGIRQTAVAVDAAPGLFVVAATDDAVHLPRDERQFYLLIFTLAVVLLVLAGATLLAEQRSLVERASFDPLTKLPNRGEFERRAAETLANAERQDTSVCLLLFDLNGFKLVNDTYGHAAGDEMLRVVGSRLRKAVRDHDIVARWGGDEFVVMMPGIADDEMGAKRAHQLADQISGRTRLDGVAEALRVKVSVGVAIWPRHGSDLHALVEAADQAMYNAKRDGETWRVADEATPLVLPAVHAAHTVPA
jgi:diguanylate cyclase (GGDEF)-like protein